MNNRDLQIPQIRTELLGNRSLSFFADREVLTDKLRRGCM